MAANDLQDPGLRLAGYAALVERFGLQVIPNRHESLVATTATTYPQATNTRRTKLMHRTG